jgi:Ran GTPase-activating protein (RanGAP) involved in mRNA processing and transport
MGLKLNVNLQIVNLQGTNLTTQSMLKLVGSLNVQLQSLDISRNPEIGIDAYKQLCEMVLENERFNWFETLQMEGNMIGDSVLQQLLQGLNFNFSIRFLNLSQNNISELGAKYIKKYLKENTILRVLFLHWNNLQD